MALTRSHLRNRILVQVQGGIEFQPAGILMYFEEFKLGTNTEIGTKDFFFDGFWCSPGYHEKQRGRK
jgi:hypothetical protein